MQGEDGGSPVILSVIAAHLDVDWGEARRSSLGLGGYLPIDMTLILTVPETDYRIRGVLSMVSLPEHFLIDLSSGPKTVRTIKNEKKYETLSEKVIVITGASSGIGEAMAYE